MSNLSRNEYKLKIAVLQRKIRIAEDAKREAQQQIQKWNQQYAEGKISYQEFAKNVATKLFPGGVAWLRYWLGVPQSQFAGTYTGNFTILCEDAREL